MPDMQNASTYNTYEICTSTAHVINPTRLRQSMDEYCQHYYRLYPAYAQAFSNRERYYNVIMFLVSVISNDAAIAALERRVPYKQDATVNQLLFEAFAPFIGLISVIQYMKDGSTKIVAFFPLGVRDSFKN